MQIHENIGEQFMNVIEDVVGGFHGMPLHPDTAAYNTYGMEAVRAPGRRTVNADVLSLVQGAVDDRLLSRPLSGLNNDDLRKVLGRISAEVNRRKKQQ